jgi:hypothetical protein
VETESSKVKTKPENQAHDMHLHINRPTPIKRAINCKWFFRREKKASVFMRDKCELHGAMAPPTTI